MHNNSAKTQSFSMNLTIQHVELDLTAEERKLFEANARLSGRKPGQHLRAILFGDSPQKRISAPTPKKKGARK